MLEGQEASPDTQLVFEDRVEALKVCKKFKGARFKCFLDRQEAVQFTLTKQPVVEMDASAKELPGEKLPYPTPSPQEMRMFGKAIESGNSKELLHLAWQNPRCVIMVDIAMEKIFVIYQLSDLQVSHQCWRHTNNDS